jgi:autotransporter-associated beta strand protein
MARYPWRRLLARLRRTPTVRRDVTCCPWFEVLEDRVALNTHTWIGTNFLTPEWSNAQNWTGGAPTVGEPAPVILIFPAPSPAFAPTDDINGLQVDKIQLSSSYNLNASPGVTLTLTGSAANAPNLDNQAGGSLISIPMVLAATTQVNDSDVNGTLNLVGALSGPGGLTKVGPGGVALEDNNSYGGVTTVLDGTLGLSINPGTKVPGPLVIGTAGASSPAAVVSVTANSEQIADTAPVTINDNGSLTINSGFYGAGLTETIGSLTMSGGFVSGPGTLILNGDVQVNAPGIANTSSNISTAALGLGNATRNFNVASGGTLNINTTIIGTGGLTKAGPGTLNLFGFTSNSYSGATTVTDGTLNLASGGVAVPGALTIGTVGVSTPAAVVNVNANEQIADNAAVTINDNGRLSINNDFYGASLAETIGSLTMTGGAVSGPGTLILGGDVQANASSLFSSGIATTLSLGNATRTFNAAAGATLVVSGSITGTGGLTKAGAGNLVLAGSANNTYSGATTVTGGILNLGKSSGAIAVPGSLTIGTAGTPPTPTATAFINASEQIADSAAVVINQNGLLDFYGASLAETIGSLTMTGGTVAGAGTLILGGDVQVNAAANPSTISTSLSLGNATRTLTTAAGATLAVTGIVSGSAGLIKAGPGTLSLGNAGNTYSGGTTINGGTVQVAADGALGAAAGGLILAGGTLASTASFATNRAVTLNPGGGTFDVAAGTTLTLNSFVSGAGALTKANTGTLVLTNAASTYSGGTVISAGTVSVAADADLGSEMGALTLAGGTLATTATFTSAPRAITVSAASGLDIAAGTTLTLGGVINGSGNLTKTNTGNLTLTATSTYAGTLTFANGSLLVTGSEPSAGVVANGGTVLAGTGRIGPLTGNGGATLRPGATAAAANGTGTFSTGPVTLNAGFTYEAEIDSTPPGQFDTLNVTGTANLGNATLTLTFGPNFNTTAPVNSTFALVTTTAGLSGTFANLPNGQVFTQVVNGQTLSFRLDYTGTAAVLTYVNSVATGVTVTLSPATINEGGTVTASGSFADPNLLDTHTVVLNWADPNAPVSTFALGAVPTLTVNQAISSSTDGAVLTITSLATASGTVGFSVSHTYTDNRPGNAPYTVTLTVTDSGGGTASATGMVVVLNVPPTATFINNGPVQEGTPAVVAFINPVDVSPQDQAAGFTYSYDFNNDGTFEIVNSPSQSAVVPANFIVSPAVTVRGRITDKDGGFTDLTTTITVTSVPISPSPFVNFVRALYQQVLHRAADTAGFNDWVNKLQTGQLTREQVATQFLTSAERYGIVVEQFYQTFWAGRPTPTGPSGSTAWSMAP